MRVWNSKAINYSIRFCGNCVNGKERGLERVSLGKYFAVFLIHIETQFYMWELSQPISFQISQYLPMNLEKLRLCNRRILYPSFYAAYTFISMRYLRKLAIDCQNFNLYIYFNYEREVQNGSNPLYFLRAKAIYTEIQIYIKSSEVFHPRFKLLEIKYFDKSLLFKVP